VRPEREACRRASRPGFPDQADKAAHGLAKCVPLQAVGRRAIRKCNVERAPNRTGKSYRRPRIRLRDLAIAATSQWGELPSYRLGGQFGDAAYCRPAYLAPQPASALIQTTASNASTRMQPRAADLVQLEQTFRSTVFLFGVPRWRPPRRSPGFDPLGIVLLLNRCWVSDRILFGKGDHA
jgi:hypothetical protein